MPDSANTYVSDLSNKVVDTINSVKITRLEDVIEAFKKPMGKYHVIEVEGTYKPVILNAERVQEANDRILRNFRVPCDRRLDKYSGYGKK